MRKMFGICLSIIAVVGLMAAVWTLRSRLSGESHDYRTRDKLQNIALALLQMQAVDKSEGRFLAGIDDNETGKPLLSWRVSLLPYLERTDLYLQFHLNEPWDSEHNKKLVDLMPGNYKGWGLDGLHGKTVFQVPTGPGTISSDATGTSGEPIAIEARNTILLVETDAPHAVPWTKPEDIVIDSRDPAVGLREHSGVFIVARADGSVTELPSDTSRATLWSYFTRAAAEKSVIPGGRTSAILPTVRRKPATF